MKHLADFVHLHNHTTYSLLDGAIKIDDLMAKAKEYGMPALALTDHGNLFGAIEFYKSAKKHGIKPIIGCEAYVAPESRHKKEPLRGFPDAGYHLILLAKNLAGYRNLVKLSSAGYLEGFYHRPRVDKELLRAHSEGLVCLSSCLNGELPAQLRNSDFKKAREVANEYADIFGRENFFVELQDHGISEEDRIRGELAKIGQELGFGLVATNDCHYLRRVDAAAHDALLCIQTGKVLTDTDRLKYETDQVYFKSDREMKELFGWAPESIENTLRIAEVCNLELELGKLHLPRFPLPSGFNSADQFLEHLARKGMEERYHPVTPEVKERLEYELKVIREMGYSGYFLIVRDFVDYALRNNFPVGPGRGSVGGSLVAYCIGITRIDPMKYGLLFERFLNPERISMPDIDIDFSDRDRDRIIQYVIDKYGEENVCQIITFGTMAARAVVRDVGRVMSLPYSEVDRIAKLIPFDTEMTLERAMEMQPDLKRLTASDPKIAQLMEYSKTLEGLSRHASVHAAGVVIAPSKLTDYVPLYRTNRDETVTQFDMKGIEEIGLLKMDFLGLRTLTVIEDTVRFVKEREGIAIDIDKIPLDDAKTFELFASGETTGLFQFESAGMRDYLRKLKPDSLSDLAAMNALYRPGPLDAYMVDEYIDRKKGKKVQYEHPKLEKILKETYGVIVFQEQVLEIAKELAGYTLGKADILRKAMGKKDAELMAGEKEEFIQGAVAHHIDKQKAERIFEQIATFGRYGFNKAHSVGYAYLAYQTGYLKAHWPVYFMAASLSSEMGNTDRVVLLILESQRLGIEVLPPDVNRSFSKFTVEDGKIRYGLAAVKNVGEGTVETLVTTRQAKGEFKSIFDFARKMDTGALNRRMVESLVLAGAFDSLDSNRARLFKNVQRAIDWGADAQAADAAGQASLFGGRSDLGISEPALEPEEKWPPVMRLTREKEVLGFYFSGNPLENYRRELDLFSTTQIGNLESFRDGEEVVLSGMIGDIKTKLDKKGKRMAFAGIEDITGRTELVIFSDVFERSRAALHPEKLVVARGRVSTKEGEKPKLVASEVYSVEEAYLRSPLALTLTFDVAERPLLDKALPLLEFGSWPGLLNIRLVSPEETVLFCSRLGGVRLSRELLESLRQFVAPEKVELSGPRQGKKP
ncbi:MAG TPA: DNA polymerase III subunit alpha [Verrucomicrobiae bacterium]|nr:DNA polymerase III subunit alpha [Verrucomicrobiae bacterium]